MTQPRSNWVGRTIANRYKLEEVLGHGGMSTVYRATDSNLRRTVAVKLIHPHLSSNPEFVRRFEKEASVVAQLRHSNIIQVYDFSHEDDTYYMVLEYVPGETLEDRLKALNVARQRLRLAETIQLMTTICEAVAYAHDRGTIHRDLKPANVMLNLQGQPILMDFGVSKMLGDTHLTAVGTIIGTATYMSPEQARGEYPDRRADIYSLGVILYEMVAGRPPFEADSGMAILMSHVGEPVPNVRQIQNSTPDSLAAVIEKAMAKEPAQRYHSAADMARALQAVDLHPSAAYPPASSIVDASAPPLDLIPSIQPTLKARPPLWVIGAAAALVLILLGLGLFFVFQPKTDNFPLSEGMVPVDGGDYLVGSDASGDKYAPPRQVKLDEFWIDQYEVTNAQYAAFVAAVGGQPPTNWPGGTFPTGQEQHPIQGATWDLATQYCEWVNKRLPTEAEWEVAARGREGRPFPWGDDEDAVPLSTDGTHPVGSDDRNRSPFGVFDMAGNVWEWVDEPYEPLQDSGDRVMRGGSYNYFKVDMAYRLKGDPTAPTMFLTAGIRCAADQVEGK